VVPRQHVVILTSEDPDDALLTWLHTRGLRKFGRPDLSVRRVPPQDREAVIDLFDRFIEFQTFGGVIEEGQEVRLRDRKVAAHWMMSVAGSHGFAVDRGRVQLGGGYKKKGAVFLGTLGTLVFEEVIPVDEAGRPLRKFRAFGRRHHLYLATEGALRVVGRRSL
jgi:hypothetical protein